MDGKDLNLLVDSTTKEESLSVVNEDVNSKNNPSVLATLDGLVMSYTKPTQNGRLYTEELCDAIHDSESLTRLSQSNNFLGEPDHPDDGRFSIKYAEVSHAIRNFRKEVGQGAYYATFDILDTPNGRILKTLIDYGTKLGVSSRGIGRTTTDKNGEVIVDPKTYKFSTFDIVVNPGNADARLPSADTTNESITLIDQVTKSINESDTETLMSLKPVLTYLVESNQEDYKDSLDRVEEYLEKEDELSTNNSTEKATQCLIDAYQKVNSLEEELSTKKLTIEELQSKIDEQSKEIESLSTLLKSYESTNSDLVLNSVDLNSKVNECNSQLSKADNKLSNYDDLKKEYKSTVEDYNQLADDFNNAVDKITKLKEDNKELLSKYDELKSKSDSDIEDLQNTVEDLTSQLHSTDKEILEYVDEIEDLSSKYIKARCSQLGVSPNAVRQRLDESLSSYSVDEIDSVIRKSYVKSRGNSLVEDSNEGILTESFKVKGTPRLKSSLSSLGRISTVNESSKEDSDYIASLKSSISSVKNNN